MDVGVIVEKSMARVAMGCVAWGVVSMEGVDAWSVASRSEVGVEAGRLHPAIKMKKINVVKKSFILFMFGLYKCSRRRPSRSISVGRRRGRHRERSYWIDSYSCSVSMDSSVHSSPVKIFAPKLPQ